MGLFLKKTNYLDNTVEYDFTGVKKGDNISVKRMDIPEDGDYRIVNELNNKEFFNDNYGDLPNNNQMYFMSHLDTKIIGMYHIYLIII